MIPSWNAKTPTASLVEVELQAQMADGSESGWYGLGRWTFADDAFARTSVPAQEDAFGGVATDTFHAAASVVAYRLRLTLVDGGHGPPIVCLLGAIASSAGPAAGDVGARGGTAGVELDVPPRTEHPQR